MQNIKMVSKVLAHRLETLLPNIIKPDQTDLVRSGYGTGNVRRALSVIQYLNTHKSPALIVSLDAEKVSEHVEYPFLFTVLEQIGLGQISPI